MPFAGPSLKSARRLRDINREYALASISRRDSPSHGMYYVAIVCPSPNVAVPPGYELSQAERLKIASTLVGIPITVQHANVEKKIAEIPAKKPLTAALMQNKLDSCGMVVGAWTDSSLAIMAVIFIHDYCQRVQSLINAGHLSSISLTHVQGSSQPVEVTLCTLPARPGSKIVFTSQHLKDAYAYKAQCELQETSSMETTADTPAVERTPLQAIIDGLSPEHR